MAFDYKKEYKEFYLSKNSPQIVTIPPMNFVAVRGHGDPNTEGADYKKAMNLLYGLSFTIKMSPKSGKQIEGYFEYVVPPLEGFWWQDGVSGIDYSHKEDFRWISCIRLPDFVSRENFLWAAETVSAKKGLDCSAAEFLTVDEGLCVQMMHLGGYDNEPATIAAMDTFLVENGYENDFSDVRMHHEIYLSDPRRCAPEKLRTVVRHPIRQLQSR